jgi:hypothetical protein
MVPMKLGVRTGLLVGIVMHIGMAQQQGLVDRAVGLISPAQDTPLTAGQRWHDYWTQMVGPGTFFGQGVSAGFSQWENSPSEWGQGGSGYGKRFGNNMAFNAVQSTLQHGTAAVVHEDNRYFASGKATVAGRLGYALASPVTARKKNGRRTISVSGITGIVGASVISRAWSPPSWQGAGNVAITMALTYATGAGMNVAREFVPGIVQHFRK